MTIKETFELAVQNQKKGNYEVAKDLYNKILKIDYNHVDAYNNLGVIFKELGEYQKAIDCYEKSIEVQPSHTPSHNNLGLVFQELGEHQKAKSCYEKVIQINPNHVQAHNNFGVVFRELGENDKAKSCFEKAIEILPNYADAHSNLGSVFRELGENDKAKSCYEKAIEINPNHTDGYSNLAVILKNSGEFQKARNCCEKAIQINPNHVAAHNNLGVVFKELGEYQKAINCYKKAIQINPSHASAHYNFGDVLKTLGEHQKAKSCYEKVIEIDPNHAAAYNNLGIVFKELGEHQKSIDCYEKAIHIKPNHVDAHVNLGIILLLLSDYQKGFDEYEWRKKLPKGFHKSKNIESLEWQGEDLTNKTILILSEQGLGDIIHFARYLFMLQDKYSVKIIFSTQKKLIHLFSTSKFKVISNESSLPKHDFHQFLCSLPKIFYKETKTIPKHINYISRDKKIFPKWKDKLTTLDGLKVGINWQGNKAYESDRSRSIPLKCFEQLFTLEKINFISLQKGFGTEQIKNFKYKDKLYDFSSEMDNGENAFEDTVGIIQNLDLAILADTGLVYLPPTLGIKTWVLLSFSHHWVWSYKSTDSLWYANTKLYRQNTINKWDLVFNNVKKDLINLKNE